MNSLQIQNNKNGREHLTLDQCRHRNLCVEEMVLEKITLKEVAV